MAEHGAGPTLEAAPPTGRPLPGWTPRKRPARESLEGDYCTLEALSPGQHSEDLFRAFAHDQAGTGWTYLPYGPFPDLKTFGTWVSDMSDTDDPLFFAILDSAGRAVGLASYLRINPEMGSIEVGHIHFSPVLQRTRAATEAMYLMARQAFELGYRRYEWKCDDLNAPSRRAAARLGFTYEGTFRQDRIYKGRNRDTAWYSITDSEWPRIRTALEAWLDSTNFDEQGRQRTRLGAAESEGAT